MQREFNLYHAWLHFRCICRMLREYIFKRKHREKFYRHLVFYGKGILRSLAIKR